MTDDRATVELETGRPAAGGGCVSRAEDGRVVFVRHSLPGERVLARITATTTSYLRADAIEILDASPARVAPPCAWSGPGRCGGCDYQHIALDEQRLMKAGLVVEQLSRLARLQTSVVVEAVEGDRAGLGWRTRVRFGVGRDGKPGLRKHRSHDLQRIDRCIIASNGVEAVGAERLVWRGAAEVEVLASPDGGAPVSSVVSRPGRRLETPRVEGGLVVDGRRTNGPGRVAFRVGARHYEVTAGVFWQVHPGAASALAGAVLEALDPAPGERAVDLYAGAGLFSAMVGERVGVGGSVLAIERDRRACSDLVRNTADLENVEVVTASVTPEIVRDALGDPDLVVLDPSREGAGPAVMAALGDLDPRPRKVVYVSCDAAAFARDVRVLLDAGWRLASLRAFDIFPMTEHVELVGLLEPPSSS